MDLSGFVNHVWHFYRQHGRAFLWRKTTDPYHIVVSEIMLQQTQTYRVEPKYEQFITELPTFADLAEAPLSTVLNLWQGLGYNRRAKFLHELAKQVVANHNGILPNMPEELAKLPGIGPNTAGSICAFVYNKPVLFIETNIRTVFIHSFFAHKELVKDSELLPLIQASLDQNNPREWYYALMDYGVHLKKTHPNPSRKSSHHTKQSKFQGSDRQIRGAIIRLLTQKSMMDMTDLLSTINEPRERVERIIAKLLSDGLVTIHGSLIHI